MKALTLTQPWATLVAIGAKKIETRSWPTRYRGPLIIHAAKNFPKEAQHLCFKEPFRGYLITQHSFMAHGEIYFGKHNFPLGAAIAVCELVDCKHILKPGWRYLDSEIVPFEIPGEPEKSFGDYSPDRFCWILENVRSLPEPIPYKGSLGLWDFPDDLLEDKK